MTSAQSCNYLRVDYGGSGVGDFQGCLCAMPSLRAAGCQQLDLPAPVPTGYGPG